MRENEDLWASALTQGDLGLVKGQEGQEMGDGGAFFLPHLSVCLARNHIM